MYTFVCNFSCLYPSIYIFLKFIGRRTIIFINGARVNANNNNSNNNNNNNNNNNDNDNDNNNNNNNKYNNNIVSQN